MVETDVAVAADIHTGTGPEIVGVPGVEWGMEAEVEAAAVGYMETSTVAAGASAKTVTSAGSAVSQMEGKTGPCAAFNVNVAGQDMNMMWGMLSNLGMGTGAGLTFSAGMGTGTELVASTGTGVEMKVLWVAEGLRAAHSWG